MMKNGKSFVVWCLLGALVSCQESSPQDEVVLDKDGVSIDDFEVKAQQLAEQIFADLGTATQANLQDVASGFSQSLGLSVANVVIYINNQGINDVASQSEQVATAVQNAFSAAIQSSGAAFTSFNVDSIVSTIQQSVSSVLTQLQSGVGINDVINGLANSVLEAAFNSVLQYLQRQPAPTTTQTTTTSTGTSTASASASTSTSSSTSAAAATTPGTVQTAAVSAAPAAVPASSGSTTVGQFTFSAEGKTVAELREEITAQAEAGFTTIESANQTSVETAVANLAVNLTQIIGEVLLSVLNAGDGVDKETEIEAITAAIQESLSIAVANAQGDLQKLDVDSIESDVAAALFTAVSQAEQPTADMSTVIQTAANSILGTISSALAAALGAEVTGSVSIDYAVASTPGTAKATSTVETVSTTPPTVAGVATVSSSSAVTLDQIQSNLSSAFEAAFTAAEEDPQNPTTQSLVQDLVLEIASSIGNALLSLTQGGDAADQTQTIVSLFQDALETAVSKSAGPVGDFDIAGVVQSIQFAASEIFASIDSSDIQTQVQSLASSIIDIIIEQLGEVIPGFQFDGQLTVTGTTTTVTVPTAETITTMAVAQPSPAGSFSIQGSASTTTVAAPIEPVVPAPVAGDCLCIDEEMLNALIDARVEQKLAETSP